MAHTGTLGSFLMRMRDAGLSAMGPQAIPGRSETFWHADGLFGQGTVQNALKRVSDGSWDRWRKDWAARRQKA